MYERAHDHAVHQQFLEIQAKDLIDKVHAVDRNYKTNLNFMIKSSIIARKNQTK